MHERRVLKVREYSHGNSTHTHMRARWRATWGRWGKGRPINIYWHSRSEEGSATVENKRQRMRSGVPGNLAAEGPAPRLCLNGKQEEDAAETRAGRMGQREGERDGLTKTLSASVSEHTLRFFVFWPFLIIIICSSEMIAVFTYTSTRESETWKVT